jgi:SDR family mycofactocin-dependent oxidoreductase
MGKLDGKVALITGAARGQGRAHAVTLAGEGAEIIAVDSTEQIHSVPYTMASTDELQHTVAEVENLDRRALAVRGDVRSSANLDTAVREGIETFGHIDILCANAGIYSRALLHELTDEQWQDMIDVNLTGVWRSLKAVAPHMIERGQGAVVLTASVNGLEGGPMFTHYTSAKHGVVGLMRASALELGPHSIRVNAVCPGVVDTPMTNWQGVYDMMKGGPGGDRGSFEEGATHYGALAGRGAMDPSAISRAVLWLVSDEDSWNITGQAIPVDNGHLVLPGAS